MIWFIITLVVKGESMEPGRERLEEDTGRTALAALLAALVDGETWRPEAGIGGTPAPAGLFRRLKMGAKMLPTWN
jgi:hypothetical protein